MFDTRVVQIAGRAFKTCLELDLDPAETACRISQALQTDGTSEFLSDEIAFTMVRGE